MGKRPAASKATRGISKQKVKSSTSNPKTTKFRSQVNSLAVIAKGGPTKKSQGNKTRKTSARESRDGQRVLDGLSKVNMIGHDGNLDAEDNNLDSLSQSSRGTKITTASFASMWSNCTNDSLNEFFHVWNPKLETHKDALAVIAGLSQTLTKEGTEQSDIKFSEILLKIVNSTETPVNVLTGSLVALTFVMRKLPKEYIIDNFDNFYQTLKTLIETHHSSKRKTLLKSLLRCFSCLTKAHPLGKEAIEGNTRKKINIAIRQCRVQNKIQL